MVRSAVLLLALVLGQIWAKAVSAQEARDPCAGGFPGASAAYARSYENDDSLAATRGFSFRSVGMAALDDILGRGNSRTVVALFARSEGKHCVYLLAGTQVVGFGAAASGDGETIAALYDRWRRAAAVQDGQVRGLRTTMLAGKKPEARKPGASPRDLALAGEKLAAALFPGDTRASLGKYERLVVLPYAGLGAMPFAALPLDGEGTLFIDLLAVSVSPGPRYFGDERPTPVFGDRRACAAGSGPATPIVVGDPVAPRIGSQTFPQLPGARSEAIDVGRRLGSEPLLGKDAVREAIAAQARDARVIHIAAHGVANSAEPLKSYLALSDGPWTAGEVQRSCLSKAWLTVLSACQSGLGANHDGGVIGLGRAFILAGSANVAMTLWNVDDEGTAVLIKHFYDALGSEMAHPDKAMRQAMLETRKTHPSPSIWAAFAMMGQPGQGRP